MFDIAEISALSGSAIEDGLPMPLKHPITGEDTGAVFMVRSYESAAYKAVERRLRTAGMKSLRKGTVSAGELDKNTIELVASLIAGWSGMKDGTGDLAFSKEAAISLLSIPIAGSNIIKQIDEFADDGAAFFKASSKPSQTPSATKSDT
ncbi:hypothetical protein OEG84_25065 [Hoeflea sp. G2-23]|uniref:Uncharacterized protein n=1 Tax=Hoeflea algicola TaxID=2983763 RepID=A0ABT3ZGF7_9HYPH|nr:hypothetical protein [Hoeflea algicola]MCY0150879.1 hypothetical protein [Hoeflea algicola]